MAELDLGEAFNYPLRQWKRMAAVGLMIFPGVFLLFIPAIMAEGYLILAAASLLAGGRELPELKDFGLMLKKGLGSILVRIVYWIFCLLIIGVAFIAAYIFFAVSTALFGQNIIVSLLFLLVLFIGFLVLAFMLLAADFMTVHYAKVGSIQAVGDIKKPFQLAWAALMSVIFVGIISLVLGVFDQLSIILLPVTGIASAYVGLVELHLYVQIYQGTENRK